MSPTFRSSIVAAALVALCGVADAQEQIIGGNVYRPGGGGPPPTCPIAAPASVAHASATHPSVGTVISVVMSAVTNCDALFITLIPANHSAGLPVTFASCTDNKSNSYAFVDSVDTSSGVGTQTLWLGGITNAPTSVTCTMTTTGTVDQSFIMVEEVSGLGPAPTLDKHSILTQSQSATYTSGTAVTTTAADFIYGPAMSQAGAITGPGSGYTASLTLTTSMATYIAYTEFKMQSVAGTAQATYSASGVADRANVALLAITPH